MFRGSFRITKDLSREITSKVDIPFLDIKRIACKSGRIEGHHMFYQTIRVMFPHIKTCPKTSNVGIPTRVFQR
ncbi:hypothetical protein [Leptospira borgpetersenii]|uniref:hypothetical protein n=1 Tax=Leptospira borgpetersenii TaxID=174 RepID=UPI0006873B73|nr:hypothetical protein [Leptospira borgpetersenii]MDQ7245018.1 hypothetical protein [Leptospira borgpetersenii]PTM44332.1 hypothetical protein CLV95_11366 [Leptospira borgpetersenii serovar Javanica]QVK49405.1 hypothetical protein FH601_10285 [Leptospira borgpetersenii]QVK52597.1 hypothetical protein FH600_03965 [Leptospira borgpetersenii]QVK55789.1 hypothetical protein FH599_03965 [Leptospira borgpetersenii]